MQSNLKVKKNAAKLIIFIQETLLSSHEMIEPHLLFKLHKEGMDYTLFRPSYPVSVFIDHFLLAKGYPTFVEERLFPNNQVELFFNLGAINRGKLYDAKEGFVFSSTILSGLRSSYLEVRPGQYFYIAGMRFTLFGFYHLFGIPAYEIVNGNFSAFDVLGKEMNILREKMGEREDEVQILSVLYQWIYSKASTKLDTAKIWSKIDHTLQTGTPQIKKSLPVFMGYSYKHTVHLLRQMTGLSPKLIQRIYRINSIFSHPGGFHCHDWADVAYSFGYTDQSHFIKEIKQFTGFTPTAILAQRPKDYLLKQLR